MTFAGSRDAIRHTHGEVRGGRDRAGRELQHRGRDDGHRQLGAAGVVRPPQLLGPVRYGASGQGAMGRLKRARRGGVMKHNAKPDMRSKECTLLHANLPPPVCAGMMFRV